MQGMHEVLYNNDQLRWSMEHSMVLNGFTGKREKMRLLYVFAHVYEWILLHVYVYECRQCLRLPSMFTF